MVQLVGTTSLGLGKLIYGKNQFVHIRYSAHSNGSNMTTEIQADTKYIGIATNSSETAPTSPSDYSWGRFVGTPGASSYTWIRYSSNADGSNMTAIPNEETKYIGVAITSEDSAPTDHTKYSWALFKGEDGRGVKKTEVSYQKSTSGTVIPTGSWSASIPSVSDGEYLWTRTLFTYTDGTTTSTYNVSRNGISGLGIARADVHYQKSTSGTTVPIGTWTVTIPAVEANEYLWTRTTITYTDDSTSVSYSVGKMGADGRDAQLLYLTATSEIQAFDSDDKPKTTQPITISAKLQNASGTATFVAIPYIGNTAQTPITLGGTGNDRTLLPSQWTDPKWTIVAITATLGSLTDTVSIHKLKDGQNGVDGADGSPGVGIESTTITYAVSTSGTVQPTSGWSATIPSVPSGQYLWTRTVWLYTNGMSETSYSVSMMGERGPQGPQGDQGNDGLPGKDGVGVRSTVITYGLSDSETTQPTSWSAQVPTLTKGKYLWTKTVWSYTDSTSETSYQKTYIARDGNDGTDGLPGKDGVGIRSTTITYAVSESGTTKPVGGWSTTVPTVPSGQYLWTRTVWTYTDDTSETGYSVAKMGERGPQGPQGLQGIQGPKGDQGIAGRPGADGLTSYTHIAYANSADGTKDFSVSDSNRTYIGVYVDFNATDSTSPGSYQWSLIKGADGADGTPGKPGVDGRTPYFHTAYANSADGSSGFSTTDSNGKLYLGTCTDYNQNDPTDYRAYTWVKIKGETGKGVKSYAITYQAGTSGTTVPTGTWSSTIPTVPKGQYLWSKTTLTYTDNTTSDTYSVAYFPVNGATGNGISSYTAEFYLSTSKTTQSGGSWTTTPPTWSSGKYLWTRYKITYTNGSTDYTTPHCSSEWEAVNDIQIGGTNLIKNTSNKLKHIERPDWHLIISQNSTKDFNIADYLGKRLTLRIWIQNPSVDAKLQFYFNAPGWKAGNVVKAGQSGYSQLTVDVPTTLPTNWNIALGGGNGVAFSLDYKELKAEIGDFATSWSPHPDDQQAQIDNLQIGGMNLWRFTKDYDGTKYDKWGQIGATQIYYKNWKPYTTIDGFGVQYITTAWDDLSQRVPVKPNTEYTLSAMIKLGNENSRVGFYVDNGTRLNILVDGQSQPVQAIVNGLSATEYRRVSITFNTGNANYSYARLEPTEDSSMYMYQPMLNEGKPKPWSPHPEDIQAEIDGIQVGGRNLLRHSEIDAISDNENSRWWYFTTDNTQAYKGEFNSNEKYLSIKYTSGNLWGQWQQELPITHNLMKLVVGDNLIIGVDVWIDDNTSGGNIGIDFRVNSKTNYNDYFNIGKEYSASQLTANTWQRIYVVGKITQKYIDNKNDLELSRVILYRNTCSKPNEIRFRRIKPELGNKPTDWTSAPEDTQAQIDQANENISNKVDQGAYDQDKSVIYDDINKKLDDEEFREFQKIMNELKGSYDSFVGEGGRYEQELKNALEREQAIVKEFGNKVNQLNFINTYIRESEEGLVIGAKNSPMQMLLSKDSLSFMDGGQTVAYFSNQSFYINRGAVVESLQVGVHKLTKVGNEHTVIQYIPK